MFTLHSRWPGLYAVRDGEGRHVGNLKLIRGRWTFKGVGYDEAGSVIPGGGPLTHHHNLVFDSLDEPEAISAALEG